MNPAVHHAKSDTVLLPVPLPVLMLLLVTYVMLDMQVLLRPVLAVSVQCALRVSTVRLLLVMAALAQIVVLDILLRVLPPQEPTHLLVTYVMQDIQVLLPVVQAVVIYVLKVNIAQ